MLPASLSALSLDAPLFLDLLILPLPFTHAVFVLVPVDTRLRCSEVNRAWRALLADTTLWERLNLSLESGLLRFSEALLHAAVAKAGGQLRELEVMGQQVGKDVLLEVVSANATTLTELRAYTQEFLSVEEVRELLQEGSALRLLQASAEVFRDRELARVMLRNEPPFQALRLRRLVVVQGLESTSQVAAFTLDLRCHASLENLRLDYVVLDTVAAMGAVVDACIVICLRELELVGCRASPATLPDLTRFIAAGTLRKFKVYNDGVKIFDEVHESTKHFVAAVRASAMTKLQLEHMGALPANVVKAVKFINARQQ